jgi:chemotaxis protein histidine kinase CheA
MENNSNDTLFGFTAITDMFTEQVGNTISQDDDIDDEELERLKQESVKARPATPGSKNKKTEEEVEEEETEDIEEEEVEEPKKSKKASKKKDKEEIEEEETEEEIEKESEEETEEDEVESKQVSALFDAIAEELEWDFDEEEEEEKPKTVEELVKYFKEVIEEQSTPEYASEDVAKLDEFVRNGGKLEDYFSITPDIDVDNVDIENENEQKIVLRELLARKGYSDKQIAKKIERFEDAGVLEDEARDAVEELQEIVAKEKEELLEQQRIKKEEMMQRQQKFFDDVVGEIKSLDNIRGIKIPAKDKKELLAYIFKADASGKTQYQKDYSKSVKNLIESAYFTMRGDTLLDAAKKQGTSSAIKNLKNSLRSTGVSKGTKRINTSSSNSIFSRAVQLL